MFLITVMVRKKIISQVIRPELDQLELSDITIAFEGLMRTINLAIPENEKSLFGFIIPNEVFPIIQSYAKAFDIDLDFALRAAILVWVIDYDKSQDAIYPMHKFTFQQLLRHLKPQELTLVEYISKKITNSRFKSALELQDMEGVQIFGENLIFTNSPDNNVVAVSPKSIIESEKIRNALSARGENDFVSTLNSAIALAKVDTDKESPLARMQLLYLQVLKAVYSETVEKMNGSDHEYTHSYKAEAARELAQLPELTELAEQLIEESYEGGLREMGKGVTGDWMDELGSIERGFSVTNQVAQELASNPAWHKKLWEMLNNPESYGFRKEIDAPESNVKSISVVDSTALMSTSDELFKYKSVGDDLNQEAIIKHRLNLLLNATIGVAKTDVKTAMVFLKEYFRVTIKFVDPKRCYLSLKVRELEHLLVHQEAFDFFISETMKLINQEEKDNTLLEIAHFLNKQGRCDESVSLVINDIQQPSYTSYWGLLESLSTHFILELDRPSDARSSVILYKKKKKNSFMFSLEKLTSLVKTKHSQTETTVRVSIKQLSIQETINELDRRMHQSTNKDHIGQKAETLINVGIVHYKNGNITDSLRLFQDAWQEKLEPHERLALFSRATRETEVLFPQSRETMIDNAYQFGIAKLRGERHISSGVARRYLLSLFYEYSMDGDYAKAEAVIALVKKYVQYPNDDISDAY